MGGERPALWLEVFLIPEREPQQPNGFLWPEAVAEISFLFHGLDLPPPCRLWKVQGTLSEPRTIQQALLMASQGSGLAPTWGEVGG